MLEGTKGQEIFEDDLSAPFLVFDYIQSATMINGSVQITVGTQRLIRTDRETLKSKIVTSGHIRMSPQAARKLMEALAGCFDVAAKIQSANFTDTKQPN